MTSVPTEKGEPMDPKAKFVELIEKSLIAYVGKSCKLAENIAGDLIAHGVTVQEWISVKDRLPEECGFYICFFQPQCGNGRWRVGQCHWNEESWVRIGAVPPHVIVTHWMPLPQPPKGEQPK
jgi:hypothetical protein